MRIALPALLLVAAAGCATFYAHQLDERYGAADPARYDQPLRAAAGAPDFATEVKPILDGRCVVCHGCYDAPCQLNLGSFEGIARGASREVVYASRLKPAEPTRLFHDALRNSGADGWRAKGFAPVLNERAPTVEANR